MFTCKCNFVTENVTYLTARRAAFYGRRSRAVVIRSIYNFVCKICQATLLSKIEVLCKTANNAVFNNCDSHFNENGDDKASDDDSESDDETECYENKEPQQPQLSVPSLYCKE